MIKMLIVEDSEDDLFLLMRALKKLKLELNVDTVSDGDAAIAYFENTSKARPKFVFLDLNLPKKSGFEVITWIRQNADLKNLPIVVLTSSNEPQDLQRAYDLGANGYLVKPGLLEQLDEIIRSSTDFWLRHNQTPIMA
jgi:CheY-like chemotaxis protein